jgi:signal peptidase II
MTVTQEVMPESADETVGAVTSAAVLDEALARRLRRQWAVFAVLAVAIVAADQVLKAWIVANFEFAVSYPVIGDFFQITFIHNSGALFGLFKDQAMVFAALSLAVVVLILWYHRHAMRHSGWVATVALGLLLGGAIGNLIDRIRLGYVIDFANMGVGANRFFYYNVADSAITISLGLLLLMAFWPRRSEPVAAG